MLYEYSHTKSESLARICTTMVKIQHFSRGLFFYWRTLYSRSKHQSENLKENVKNAFSHI